MKTNPLTEVRDYLDLSIGAMAAMLGIPYHAWYQAEKGACRIPRKTRSVLAELGVDVVALEERQERWVQERAERLRAELAERINIEAMEVVT
jgi:DNA-binding XRE family transcriptional regulator